MAGQKILLVEDEAITALDIRTSLIRLGYEVPAVVPRGEDVMRTASELHPDLILMDILLAGAVSGIDAADEVRTSLRIPVVFLTAHSDPEMIARAARTEPFGYLSKPCNLTDLMSTIEMAMKKSAADARVRESEARFRVMADGAPVLIWMTGSDGECSFVNRPWLEFTGRTLEQETGSGWGEGLHPDDRPRAEEIYCAALERKGRFEMEYRLRRADGEYRVLLERAEPRFESTGAFAGFVGSCVDVTERKVAEEGVKQERESFQKVLSAVPVGLLLVNRDAVITHANRAMAQIVLRERSVLIGERPDGVLGCADSLEEPGGPGVATACSKGGLRKAIEAVLATGERLTQQEVALSLHVAGADLERCLSVSVEPVEIEGSRCAVVAVDDVTERRRVEEQVRQLAADLELRVAERTAELEAFSYTVAHDLKAPLRGIDGFSEMLLEDEGDRLTEEGRRMLGRIGAASRRGGRLIEDLLHLSRLTNAGVRIGRIDLSTLAVLVSERLQAAQPDRQIECVIEPGLTVDADAGLVEGLLEQLLGNAWKFTSKKEAARIELGATEKDGKRVFFVRDDGAGFDMAHAGELFGAFHRAHTEAEFPGLGIGLAIVAKIIGKHGGTVWAEGEVGKGATVYFTL